jgi:hypothetical protein
MHKSPKEQYNYTIVTWKEIHQYSMDDLVAHRGVENCLY